MVYLWGLLLIWRRVYFKFEDRLSEKNKLNREYVRIILSSNFVKDNTELRQ